VKFQGAAFDPDGAVVSAVWKFLDGTMSMEGSPMRSYDTPLTERAVFTATDDKGLSSSAVVEVEITAASGEVPPTIVSAPRTSVYAGVPYTYDKDGLPTARGTGPFSFALAASPMGATIDKDTGKIDWTPTIDQMADFKLDVTGKAGKATQSWKVEVVKSGVAQKSGCGCGTDGGLLGVLSSLVLLRLRRRRP